jgi:hypothetical protein
VVLGLAGFIKNPVTAPPDVGIRAVKQLLFGGILVGSLLCLVWIFG